MNAKQLVEFILSKRNSIPYLATQKPENAVWNAISHITPGFNYENKPDQFKATGVRKWEGIPPEYLSFLEELQHKASSLPSKDILGILDAAYKMNNKAPLTRWSEAGAAVDKKVSNDVFNIFETINPEQAAVAKQEAKRATWEDGAKKMFDANAARAVPASMAGQAAADSAAREMGSSGAASGSGGADAGGGSGGAAGGAGESKAETQAPSIFDKIVQDRINYYKSLTNPVEFENDFYTRLNVENLAREDARRMMEDAARVHKKLTFPTYASKEEERTGGAGPGVDTTLAGTPGWLSGPEGVQKKLIELETQSYNQSITNPYPAYTDPRIAPLTGNQKKASALANKLADDEAVAQDYATAFGHAATAGKRSVLDEIAPLLQSSAESVLPEIEQYMSPYRQSVVEAIKKSANERFKEEIEPEIRGRYIRNGSFNSKSYDIAREKAWLKHQEQLNDQLNKYLDRGYELAMSAAERGKGRQMHVASQHAAVGSNDETRRIDAARTLADLQTSQHSLSRSDVDLLQQLGTQEQAYGQSKLNQQYQDYLAQKNAPKEALDRLYAYVNRMPMNNTVTASPAGVTPPIPQPSAFTTFGGMGLGLLGLNNQMRQGRAEGGSVSYIPEQIDLMNRMREHASQLEGSNSHPIWSYLSNLGAGIAGSKSPTMMGSLREAIPSAHKGFEGALERNNENKMRSLAIRQALVESQLMQQERDEKRKMIERNFELEKLKTNAYVNSLNAKTKAYSTPQGSIGGTSLLGPVSKIEERQSLKKLEHLQNAAETAEKRLEMLHKLKQAGEKFTAFEDPLIASTETKEGESGIIPGLKKTVRNWYFKPEERESIDVMRKEATALTKALNPKNETEAKIIYEGMPRANLNPEAYKQAIATQKYNANEDKSKLAFFEIWRSLTGSAVKGNPDTIFNEFKNEYNLIDEEGNLNPEAVRVMPNYIQSVLIGDELPHLEMEKKPKYKTKSRSLKPVADKETILKALEIYNRGQ